MYELKCPQCGEVERSPFVRPGAVTDCPHCSHRYRIRDRQVSRQLPVSTAAAGGLLQSAAPAASNAPTAPKAPTPPASGAGAGSPAARGSTAASGRAAAGEKGEGSEGGEGGEVGGLSGLSHLMQAEANPDLLAKVSGASDDDLPAGRARDEELTHGVPLPDGGSSRRSDSRGSRRRRVRQKLRSRGKAGGRAGGGGGPHRPIILAAVVLTTCLLAVVLLAGLVWVFSGNGTRLPDTPLDPPGTATRPGTPVTSDPPGSSTPPGTPGDGTAPTTLELADENVHAFVFDSTEWVLYDDPPLASLRQRSPNEPIFLTDQRRVNLGQAGEVFTATVSTTAEEIVLRVDLEVSLVNLQQRVLASRTVPVPLLSWAEPRPIRLPLPQTLTGRPLQIQYRVAEQTPTRVQPFPGTTQCTVQWIQTPENRMQARATLALQPERNLRGAGLFSLVTVLDAGGRPIRRWGVLCDRPLMGKEPLTLDIPLTDAPDPAQMQGGQWRVETVLLRERWLPAEVREIEGIQGLEPGEVEETPAMPDLTPPPTPRTPAPPPMPQTTESETYAEPSGADAVREIDAEDAAEPRR